MPRKGEILLPFSKYDYPVKLIVIVQNRGGDYVF
jgi:hypothetical protein